MLGEKEIEERTNATIKMANVTGQSVEEISNQLTAVWNNFDNGTKSLEYYADVLTALGAATASSSDEIVQGLEKFAAVGDTIGLSYEYAASALATITSNTRQSADVVGTALKTIFARIQGLNLGETADDGTNLNKYSEALFKVGVNIKDASGQLKDMDTILNELGARWGSLSKETQTALAQTTAGMRQYTQFIALMDNWNTGDSDSFMTNLATAQSSEGSLQRQQDIYAESWEAARDRVAAAAEDIYSALINDEFFIDMLNGFEKILNGVNGLIEGLGGLEGVLLTISSIVTRLFSGKIASGLISFGQTTRDLFGAANKRNTALQAEAMQEQGRTNFLAVTAQSEAKQYTNQSHVAMDKKITAVQNNLNPQQQQVYKALRKNAEVTLEQYELDAMREDYFDKKFDNQVDSLAPQVVDRMRGTSTPTNKKEFTTEMYDTLKLRREYQQENTSLDNITKNLTLHGDTGNIKTDGLGLNSQAIKAITAYNNETDKSKRNVKELIATLEKLKNENTTALQNDVKKLGEKYDLTNGEVKELINTMDNLNNSTKEVEASSEAAKAAVENVTSYLDNPNKDNSIDVNDLGQKTKKIKEKNKEKKKTKAPLTQEELQARTQGFVQLASSITGVASAMSIMGNAWDTISSPDTTPWEKLTTFISAAVPALSMLTIAFNKNSLVQIHSFTASALSALGFQVTEKSAYKAATGVTFFKMTMIEVLLPIMAIVAAVALLVAGATALFNWYNQDAIAAERAEETAKKMRQAAEEAQQAYDDIAASADNYDNLIKKLEECTEGTEEWNAALKEVNDATADLISKYPELLNYADAFNSDGTINQEVLDKVVASYENNANVMRTAALVSGAQAAKAQAVSKETNFVRESEQNNSTERAHIDNLLESYEELGQEALSFDNVLKELYGSTQGVTDAQTEYAKGLQQVAQNYVNAENQMLNASKQAVRQWNADNNAELTAGEMNALAGAEAAKIEARMEELIQMDHEANSKWTGKDESGLADMFIEALGEEGKNYKHTDTTGNDDNREYVFKIEGGEEVSYSVEHLAQVIATYEATRDRGLEVDKIIEIFDDIEANNSELVAEALTQYTSSQDLASYSQDQIAALAEKFGIKEGSTAEEVEKAIKAAYPKAAKAELEGMFGKNFGQTALDLWEKNEEATERLIDSLDKEQKEIFNKLIKEDSSLSLNNKTYIRDLIQNTPMDIMSKFANELEESFENTEELDEFLEAMAASGGDIEVLETELAKLGITLEEFPDLEKIINQIINFGKSLSELDFGKPLQDLRNAYQNINKLKVNDIIDQETYDTLIESGKMDKDDFKERAVFNTDTGEWENQYLVLSMGSYDNSGEFNNEESDILDKQIQDEINKRNEYQSLVDNYDEDKILKDGQLDPSTVSSWYEQAGISTYHARNIIEALEKTGQKENLLEEITYNGVSKSLVEWLSIMALEEKENEYSEKYDDLQTQIFGKTLNFNDREMSLLIDAFVTSKIGKGQSNGVEPILEFKGYEQKYPSISNIISSNFDEQASWYDVTSEEAEYYKQIVVANNNESDFKPLTKDKALELVTPKESEDGSLYYYPTNEQRRIFQSIIKNSIETLNNSISGTNANINDKTNALFSSSFSFDSLTQSETFEQASVKDKQDAILNTALNIADINEINAGKMIAYAEALQLEGFTFLDSYRAAIDILQDNTLKALLPDDIQSWYKDLASSNSIAISNVKKEVATSLAKLFGISSNLINKELLSDNNIQSTIDLLQKTSNDSYTAYQSLVLKQAGYTGDLSWLEQLEFGTLLSEQFLTDFRNQMDNLYGKGDWDDILNNIGFYQTETDGFKFIGSDSTYTPYDYSIGSPIVIDAIQELIDKYYEYETAIQAVDKALERLEKTSEKAIGDGKLAAIQEEINLRKQQIENYETQRDYAQSEFEKSKQDFANTTGLSAEFDEYGRILNYKELYAQGFAHFAAENADITAQADAINAAKEAYAATGVENQATEEEIEKMEEELSKKQNDYELNKANWEKSYEALLNDVNKYQDSVDAIVENEIAIREKEIENITSAMEFSIRLNDAQASIIQHSIDNMQDDFLKMAEASELVGQLSQVTEDTLRANQNAWHQMKEALNENKIKMEDLQEYALDDIETLLGYINTLQSQQKQQLEYYGNFWSKANEEFEYFYNLIEGSSDDLKSYIDLLGLIGQDKNYEKIEMLLEGQRASAARAYQSSVEYRDTIKAEYDILRERYENEVGKLNEYEKEMLENQLRSITEQLNEAENRVLEDLKKIAENAQALLENSLAEADETLQRNLFDGQLADDYLEEMSRLSILQEEFLTTTNKMYSTNKLIREATLAMEKTENTQAKQLYNNYIKEVKKAQEKNKLTNYELSILEAKYKLTQAQIALEEAQNAKSTVRLRRDGAGNFGYVYTADADKIAEAEQNFADAENNLYEISLQGLEEYNTKIVQNRADMMEALNQIAKDNTLQDEERERKMAETKAHYLALEETYERNYQAARDLMRETSYNKDIDYQTMNIENLKNLEEATDEYMLSVSEAWDDYGKHVTAVTNATDWDTLKGKTENVKNMTEELRDVLIDPENGLIKAIGLEAKAVRDATDAYAAGWGERQKYLEQLEREIEERMTLAKLGNSTSANFDSGIQDYAQEIANQYQLLAEERKQIDRDSMLYYAEQHFKKAGGYGVYDYDKLIASTDVPYLIKAYKMLKTYQLRYPDAFDTGGYTGTWGPEGRIAMLHQKELVLNPTDTENFLASISILREISHNLDLAAGASLYSMTGFKARGIGSTAQELLQNVHIEASFPNVSDHNEIEIALLDLTNKASQFVNKREQ